MGIIAEIIIIITILAEAIGAENVIRNFDFIIVLIIIYVIVRKIIGPKVGNIIKENNEKNSFSFNEFEDFEKIEQQEEENEQLKNEWNAIKGTYSEQNEEEELKEGVPIATILKEDTAFDADLFKKWSKNIFEYMQLGKEEELKQIKDSISEELFDRKIQQLHRFERDNLELKRENLLIEEIKIMDYSRWSDKAELKVYVETQLTEYIINKTTQKVLKGNNEKINNRSFIMTFRKKDSEKQVGFVRNCQSCGATIADTEFSRCQYCGSLVNPIRYNWTLIKFEVI